MTLSKKPFCKRCNKCSHFVRPSCYCHIDACFFAFGLMAAIMLRCGLLSRSSHSFYWKCNFSICDTVVSTPFIVQFVCSSSRKRQLKTKQPCFVVVVVVVDHDDDVVITLDRTLGS